MLLSVVILAAGKGTRMRSNLPKVLHKLADKPMVQHIIDNVKGIGAENIHMIYGHGGDLLKKQITDQKLNWIEQSEQLGTGHAVQMALPYFKDNEKILIVYGDVPLLSSKTLESLIAAQPENGIALLTVDLDDPKGYGRIERTNSLVTGIVEEKDADQNQRTITEVNTGILVANAIDLASWLPALSNDNASAEYYLTDIINMAHLDGRIIKTIHPEHNYEVEGVNNKLQLANLERTYQLKKAQELLLQGVQLRDPARFDLRGELICGSDVEIDVNVIINGKVTLGDGVLIGANCILIDCTIANNVEIKPNSIIESSIVGNDCVIGPFSRIRPNTELKNNVHVGNFVEIKKSVLGDDTKCGHLTYLGDSIIGERVNVGAGTITCNYDGANKHLTRIEDDAFIGSNCELVAPVIVGKGATTGAGSTIVRDVPDHALSITRTRQKSLSDWARPTKNK